MPALNTEYVYMLSHKFNPVVLQLPLNFTRKDVARQYDINPINFDGM
jgi:hypothetical protein